MATTIPTEQPLATFPRAIRGRFQHAVDPRDKSYEHQQEFDTQDFTLCGQKVHVTHRWGVFGDDNPISRAFGRCPDCGWIAALQRGETEEELQRYAQTAGTDGNETALVVNILTAVLDAQGGGDGLTGWETHGEHSRLSQLLGHISAHAPAVFVCSGCAEDDECDYSHTPQYQPGVCPGRRLACMACTALADEWAGEWEGKTLGECFVTSPCSVLAAAAQYYGIAIAPGAERQPVTADKIVEEILERWYRENDRSADFSIESEHELRGYIKAVLAGAEVTRLRDTAEPIAVDGGPEDSDERDV